MNTIPFPLSIDSLWHYHQGAGKHPPSNMIQAYQERVELVTGGRGWIRHNGDWREVLPGDLIWNAPGDSTIGRSDFENPYRCLSVLFRVRRAKGMGVPRFSKWPDIEEINVFANEAPHLMMDDSFDRQLLRDYVFSRLLFHVRLSERTSRSTQYPAPIRAVITCIERDFAQPLLLDDLAREAGWSVPHLHAQFRKHLQTTPHKLLMQKRLRVARERLISTSEPVKSIAVECGFSDMAAFGHAFKAQTGQTPSAYRNYHMRREIH